MDKIKQIIEEIESIKQDYIVIAIDGRCASGKTTLAEKLAQYFHANVFHMDDYFLRKEQRKKDYLKLVETLIVNVSLKKLHQNYIQMKILYLLHLIARQCQ